MFLSIIICIFIQSQLTVFAFLQVDFRHPKIERNTVVNKGVWIRKDDSEKTRSSFLFRGNAVDIENMGQQNDFNAFSDGNVPNSPYITSYVERNKRSPIKHHKRIRKSLKGVNTQTSNTNDIDDPALVKSKFITKLKPSTVFNDYPYEIAILLGNNKQTTLEAHNYSTYIVNDKMPHVNTTAPTIEHKIVTNKIATKNENKTISTKRSSTLDNEVNKNIELLDDLNATHDVVEQLAHVQNDRDVFPNEEKVWHQTAPIPADTHKYKVISKTDDSKIVRPITERGLIKVLSMLTNTFKKIMKQHTDIKDINKKLNDMNKDFLKNIEIVSDKFQDFETKYNNLVAFNQKIADMEEKLFAREQHFKSKERELSKNLIEFEIQQKKFLTQQRQFYNIQKLMLSQNERINTKQNAIAKTQSEISHRQNNFARILKKAKQIYVDTKLGATKTTAFPKDEKIDKHSHEKSDIKSIEPQTTTKPNTESVKINLFTVPTVTRIQNQDHLLLSDKDEEPVDDLVYKYYFNNTFIETLMKNFLSGFISSADSHDRQRNIKNKRDEAADKTTLLLPVNKIEDDEKTVIRERRWIGHHSRKKHHRNKGRIGSETNNIDDEKTPRAARKSIDSLLDKFEKTLPTEGKTRNFQKSEPFISMAKNFCTGIGQNASPQVLEWCIEKALRRLQNIDINVSPPPSSSDKVKVFHPLNQPTEPTEQSTTIAQSTKPGQHTKKLLMKSMPSESRLFLPSGTMPSLPTESNPSSPSEILSSLPPTPATSLAPMPVVTTSPVLLTQYTPLSTIIAETTQNLDVFFPDNDQLESNLKQFDLKPDLEGNVYYDGSLHASDLARGYTPPEHDHADTAESMGTNDSNSKIDTMYPDTYDSPGTRRRMLQRSLYSRMKYESMIKKTSKI